MNYKFISQYPSIADLKIKARKKIPRFAFEYLNGGCNDDVNIKRNNDEIRNVQLRPEYIKKFNGSSLKTSVFGIEYDFPFGIAPIGLQGLMWPNSPEILAKSAFKNNIPFILSTVSTSSIERISEITEGKFWFQLYHPAEDKLTNDLIIRTHDSGCKVLVILCDVPTFGYRPKDIKNGLSMPPKMNLNNFFQIFSKPHWAVETIKYGQPSFETLKPYMPKGLNLKQLGGFMNQTFDGRLNEKKIKKIRDNWKGKLVLKGVSSEFDVKQSIRLGIDGIIISNHGGRQLDAGPSSIKVLEKIAPKYGDKIEIMMDSGIRSGADISRTLATGAKFTFLGRSFMYGVCALGKKGGDQTIHILKTELNQIMEQLCCEKISDLPFHILD
ncbi:MAG: alpha-hydroxy-acid oxidizing protein [Flavobacteriaceae bacterium]|nr:MAG: alpha-hydroxy-acid oxidizing protein [Flavobacteriaceae bacterium TMED220]